VGQVVFTARLDLPTGPPAVRFGRDAARLLLSGWGLTDEDVLDRVELIVSELVSNVVRHADGPSTLEVGLDDRCVTAAVLDSSTDHPTPRIAADDLGGRGLPIIEAISTGWGSHAAPGGKRVWARIDLGADPLSP
jgi:anti-sigma regulatory factor (Ser/Thr protein kinase)